MQVLWYGLVLLVIHVISEADSDYLYAEGVKMEACCYNGFLDLFF